MTVVVSSVFQILCFPHEGRIVIIDQMVLSYSSSMENMRSIVPWIEKYHLETKSIGVGMCLSLMGTFNFPTSVAYIHSILVSFQNSSTPAPMTRVRLFRTLYLQDAWVLPSSCESVNGRTCQDGYATLYR
jgi:hypothetical protein